MSYRRSSRIVAGRRARPLSRRAADDRRLQCTSTMGCRQGGPEGALVRGSASGDTQRGVRAQRCETCTKLSKTSTRMAETQTCSPWFSQGGALLHARIVPVPHQISSFVLTVYPLVGAPTACCGSCIKTANLRCSDWVAWSVELCCCWWCDDVNGGCERHDIFQF